ncbi:flagellar hook-length control protein FliK [Fictibacillus sp. BK138]|uniref:flagellar hook-length control protein FliK n=1 Tax=Fictibacillus sp. BK138 TaxID=2512121 RepID=UPI00102A2410|nr:flagellar hook-length control protein FliK [Fictibacillus sp. BK138]RZT22938.1 flagellar hook-length control protein FliK [Fictibacillus sp. BK138]
MQVMMAQSTAPVQTTQGSKQTSISQSLFSQFLLPAEQIPSESSEGAGALAAILANLLSATEETEHFWNPEAVEDPDVQALLNEFPDEIKEMIESLMSEQISGTENIQIHAPEMKLAILLQAMFNDKQHSLSQPQQKELTHLIEKWFPGLKLDSKDALPKQVEQIFSNVKKLLQENGSTDKNSFYKIMEQLSTVKKVQTFAEQAYQRYVPVKQTEQVSKEFQTVQSPLSSLEQWTLKVPASSEEGQKQQFVREIQQIISRGKLMVTEAGFTKMQIKLTPENLGTIEIQLTQKHGEIAAKIIASSQAAKDALDGQLTQLKQAFAGQNIDFEKLEVIFQNEEQSFQFHDQESQNHKEQHQPNDNETDDSDSINLSFEEQLSQMVLNEKV